MPWGGAFASRFASDRVQDRYLFFVVPLLAVVLLAGVELGAPRPFGPLLVGGAVVLALVTAFPYDRFVGEPARSDTFSLIPLWTANEHLVDGSYRLTVLADVDVVDRALEVLDRRARLPPAHPVGVAVRRVHVVDHVHAARREVRPEELERA